MSDAITQGTTQDDATNSTNATGETIESINAFLNSLTAATATDADLDRVLAFGPGKNYVLEEMRQDCRLREVWGPDTREGTPCMVCGGVVAAPKRHRGNNAFGKASHLKGHINRGEAWNYYHGGTDGFVMPSHEDLRVFLHGLLRKRDVAPLLEQLKAERAPKAAERKALDRQRTTAEKDLVRLVRECGPVEGVERIAREIRRLTVAIGVATVELEAIHSKYPADVAGKITMGDL